MGIVYDDIDNVIKASAEPLWTIVPGSIMIDAGYIDHYISESDIEKINKEVGIPGFVSVPRELGGGGGLTNCFIDIGIGLFSAAMYDGLKIALQSIFKKFKSNIKRKERGRMTFRIGDYDSPLRVDIAVNLSGDIEQIEEIIKKVIRIKEIVEEDSSK
jgi:hypothetical protein